MDASAVLQKVGADPVIRMTDGTAKPVEELRIGDEVLAGGPVLGRGEVLVGEVFRYRGEVVNGAHAVFEDGRWLRVRDSELAELVDIEAPVIAHPVVTLNQLMVTASGIISADFAELDEAYPNQQGIKICGYDPISDP